MFLNTNAKAPKSTPSSEEKAPKDGAGMYQRYLKLQEEIQELEEAAERLKSEKMFEAWKQAAAKKESGQTGNSSANASTKSKKKNDRMAGVAVIRTLAKETNKPKGRSKIEGLKQEAAALLISAANSHQHPQAMVQLGNDALARDEREVAIEYYERAGELGSTEAWFNLGHCLWKDDACNDKSSPAFVAFRKAADLGDGDAKYFLGVHMLGRKDSKTGELRKGLRLVQDAARMNHGGALHYLVLFHRSGNEALGIKPCSSRDFMDRLDKAVESDTNGDSYFLRGSCYLAGDVYEKSPHKAFHDLFFAAELGHSDAAVSAGALLHHGVAGSIAQDRRTAFQLYQHAGELGNVEGWRNVVSCYLQGHGVPKSTLTATYIAETMLRTADRK